jgi:hypothetical protein
VIPQAERAERTHGSCTRNPEACKPEQAEDAEQTDAFARAVMMRGVADSGEAGKPDESDEADERDDFVH